MRRLARTTHCSLALVLLTVFSSSAGARTHRPVGGCSICDGTSLCVDGVGAVPYVGRVSVRAQARPLPGLTGARKFHQRWMPWLLSRVVPMRPVPAGDYLIRLKLLES